MLCLYYVIYLYLSNNLLLILIFGLHFLELLKKACSNVFV